MAVELASERIRVNVNDVVNDVLSLLEHQFAVGRIKVRRELSEMPDVEEFTVTHSSRA